jgi:hypothetical protein
LRLFFTAILDRALIIDVLVEPGAGHDKNFHSDGDPWDDRNGSDCDARSISSR